MFSFLVFSFLYNVFLNEIVSIGPEDIFVDDNGDAYTIISGKHVFQDNFFVSVNKDSEVPVLLDSGVKEIFSVYSGLFMIKNGINNKISTYGIVPALNSSNSSFLYSFGNQYNLPGLITSPTLNGDPRFKYYNQLIISNSSGGSVASTIEENVLSDELGNSGFFINQAINIEEPHFLYDKILYTPSFAITINKEEELLFFHGKDPAERTTSNYSFAPSALNGYYNKITDIFVAIDNPKTFLIFETMGVDGKKKYNYLYQYTTEANIYDTKNFLPSYYTNFEEVEAISFTGEFSIPYGIVDEFFTDTHLVCYTTKIKKRLYCSDFRANYGSSGWITYKEFIDIGLEGVVKVEFMNGSTMFILDDKGNLYLYGVNPTKLKDIKNISFLKKPVVIATNVKDVVTYKREYRGGQPAYYLDKNGDVYTFWDFYFPFFMFDKNNFFINDVTRKILRIPFSGGNVKIKMFYYGKSPVLVAEKDGKNIIISQPTDDMYMNYSGTNDTNLFLSSTNNQYYNFNPDAPSDEIVLKTYITKLTLKPQDIHSGATKFVKTRNQAKIGAALTDNGVLVIYGDNSLGQHGDSSTDTKLGRVTIVGDGSLFIQDFAISSGKTICFVTSTGDVFCSGEGEYGQLGVGTSPPQFTTTFARVKTGTSTYLQNISKIFSRNEGFCALSNGVVYCWGRNTKGELCTGNLNTIYFATQISLLPNSIVDISENNLNVGRIGFYLNNNGTIYGCGDNTLGRLAAPSLINVTTPAPIKIKSKKYNNIKAKNNSLCLSNEVSVTCFGELAQKINKGQNFFFRPEYNSVSIKHLTSMIEVDTVFDFNKNTICYTNYYELQCLSSEKNGLAFGCDKKYCSFLDEANDGFSDVRLGEAHACALTNGYRVFCWGKNNKGQVGKPSGLFYQTPVEVFNNPLNESVLKIATGNNHSCLLYDIPGNESVYCWGDNHSGQLGDGTTRDKNIPTRITLPSKVTLVNDLAASGEHTCFSATVTQPDFSTKFEVWCAGDNTYGQTGENPKNERKFHRVYTVPEPSHQTAITQILTSERKTCFSTYNTITLTSKVFCMGDNRDKSISQSEAAYIYKPQEIAINSNFFSFFLGDSLFCEVDNNTRLNGCRGGNPLLKYLMN